VALNLRKLPWWGWGVIGGGAYLLYQYARGGLRAPAIAPSTTDPFFPDVAESPEDLSRRGDLMTDEGQRVVISHSSSAGHTESADYIEIHPWQIVWSREFYWTMYDGQGRPIGPFVEPENGWKMFVAKEGPDGSWMLVLFGYLLQGELYRPGEATPVDVESIARARDKWPPSEPYRVSTMSYLPW